MNLQADDSRGLTEASAPSRTFVSAIGQAGIVALLGAIAFGFCWLRYRYCPEYEVSTFQRMLAGTAETPFQYRVLVPLVVRGLMTLGVGFGGLDPSFAVDVACVFGTLVLCFFYLRRLEVSRWWVLGLIWILLANYVADFGEGLHWRACYDMPALLFSFGAVILLRERRYAGFYALLPVALLNRESAALFTLLFVCSAAGTMPRRRVATEVAAQLALVLAVKLILAYAYRASPGAGAVALYARDWTYTHWEPGQPIPTELRFIENLYRIARLELLPVYGFLWVPFLFTLRLVRDEFLRRSTLIVPVVLAIMMIVGNISEFRVFTETVPTVLFCTALGWTALRRGRSVSAVRQTAGQPP